MKNRLYVLLILSACFSCKSKSNQNTKDSTVTNTQTEALIKKFKPILQGVWVKADYIADIIKTRSPYNSKSKILGIASIEVEMKDLTRDSILAGVSLNNHEDAQFTIYFKPGERSNSLKINWPDYEVKGNFYELGYDIKNSDTSLVLYHYTKNQHLLDSTIYSKVLNSQSSDDAGYGIQYITNKKLISGSYVASGIDGPSFKANFDNEGNVSGLLDFKTYYMSTDFEVGIENNMDQIYFDIDTKKQKSYLYKFNADTLNLYETTENSDSTKLVLGRLKYKLVRQK